MKKILPNVLAAIAVLALLILVPSSPAFFVEYDPHTLLFFKTGVDQFGLDAGLSITMYSLFIAAGAAIAFVLSGLLGKKRLSSKFDAGLFLTSGVFALCCSHWLFCALRWGYIINDLCETPAFIFQFWKGGYTMYGALLGGLLGAFVYAKLKRLSVGNAMDTIMPGAAVMIALGRFAELFSSQGRGTEKVNEALSMIPFVVEGEWSMQVQVYAYEALAAAAALAVMLVLLLRGKSPSGHAAEAGLTIISAAQVLLDSWRGDELIRFGFVRLNMIAAAVTLLFLMILRVIRAVKTDGKATPWTIIRVVLLFLGAGIVLIAEFGLDGKMGITASNTLLYAIQTAAVILMGATVLIDGKKLCK